MSRLVVRVDDDGQRSDGALERRFLGLLLGLGLAVQALTGAGESGESLVRNDERLVGGRWLQE